MTDQVTAAKYSVSLYPEHTALVNEAAKQLGIADRAYSVSPALQHIIEEWDEQRRMLALLPATTREALRQHLATAEETS